MKWHKVYQTEISHRAEMVKDILVEIGVQSIIINKKDSSYNNFGFYEVMVQQDQVMKALKTINNDIAFE